MKLLFIIILSLLLTACAQTNLPSQPRVVDPALEANVQSFETLWGQSANMTIEFSSLGGSLAGLCNVDLNSPYAYGTRTIQIDSTYWNEIDANGQEQLVWHELGHCALGRVHWSVLNGSTSGCTWDLSGNCDIGFPLTIMYPVAFGNDGYYAQNRPYYISELFGNNPTHKDANQSPIEPMGDYFIKNAEVSNAK